MYGLHDKGLKIQGAVHLTQMSRSLIVNLVKMFLGGHSNIARSWYAQARKFRKLQNQNALLNHLANKIHIKYSQGV